MESFCYFVHSFYCEPEDEAVVAGETEYGATVCFGGRAGKHLRRAVSSGEEPGRGLADAEKLCAGLRLRRKTSASCAFAEIYARETDHSLSRR